MKHYRITLVGLSVFVMAACQTVNPDTRPMPRSEKTVVSEKVAQMVEENDGEIDTRNFADVRCERVRLTGTHITTRHCYTLAEREAADRANQDAVRDSFGAQPCLTPSRCSSVDSGSPQRAIRRGPGGG